ncbi:MAG: hypothetical protein PHU46_05400 [Rhodocyclaceae bacterium]|nr:hypothetical protein [Rhodocyclaceae bacterium]
MMKALSGLPRLVTALRLMLITLGILWMGSACSQGNLSDPALELRFSDFFHLPVGPGGLELSPVLQQARGRTVRLVGYMVQQEVPVAGRFMLAPRPVQMSEHADGDADDLPPATLLVYLDPDQQGWVVPHMRGLVSVTGVLAVGRQEDPDGRVSWVRLQLGPRSVRGAHADELAIIDDGHPHHH